MKAVILDGYTVNPGDLSWKGIEETASLTVYDRTGQDQVIQRIGDCEAVCPVNAITIEKSLARVDSVACIGCGMCARTCPTGVITTLPRTAKVVVECSTKLMLRIVVFVYLISVVLFLAGYVITSLVTASVGVQYAVAGAGFVLGIVFAILYDRRLRAKGGLSFTIVRLF